MSIEIEVITFVSAGNPYDGHRHIRAGARRQQQSMERLNCMAQKGRGTELASCELECSSASCVRIEVSYTLILSPRKYSRMGTGRMNANKRSGSHTDGHLVILLPS